MRDGDPSRRRLLAPCGPALAGVLLAFTLGGAPPEAARQSSPADPARGVDASAFLKTTMRLDNLGSVTPNARRYDISPDWTTLAAPSDAGTVLLFDVATGQPGRPLEGGFKVGTFTYTYAEGVPPSYFGFSSDGRFLIWSWGKKIVVWGVATRELVLRQEIEGLKGNHVHVSPDGRFLAWSTSQGLTLWDVSRRAAESPPGKDVQAFSPDGQLLALASELPGSWEEFRRSIPMRKTIWDIVRREPRATYEGLCLGFSPDGRFVLTTGFAGVPGGIRLWEVATSQPRVLSADGRAGESAWSSEGRFLAFVDANNDVEVWDLQAEVPAARVLPGREKGNRGRCVDFDGDGRRGPGPDLLLGQDGRILCDSCRITDVWDLSQSPPTRVVRTGLLPLGSGRPVLSRDGRTLAYTWGSGRHLHGGGGIALWDVASGRALGSPIEVSEPGAIKLSPDGALLATVGLGRAPAGERAVVAQIWSVEAMRAEVAARP